MAELEESYWQKIVEIARQLPGVEESTSYGTRALKVKGQLMVRMKEDGETLVVRVDFYERQLLMDSEPETFFITDHYRDYPAVLIRLARIDDEQLAERLEAAWRFVAPKPMVSEFDRAD